MTAPASATRVRELSRALVLGGAGFLGGWVTQELRQAGVHTTVLGYGADRPEDLSVAITRASLEDMVVRANPDAVVFLAGSPSVPRSVRDPRQDLHDNTGLVVDVLEVLRARSVPPLFVFTSSAAVYGESRREPMDEKHPLVPRSPYGISKLAAEHYVRLYAETYRVPGFSVRPFSVYGPGQRKLVVYDLFVRLLEGEDPLVIQSAPEVARDFVYVGDLARALATLMLKAPGVGEAYNIASGKATTLSELAGLLVETGGSRAIVRFAGTARVGDPFRWRGDPARASSLGAVCSTSLEDGLHETLSWIQHDLERA